jgi:DNA-binding CsgD family transcriptional regulator/pimeloyl-ACP methyl ester carboxylesterase
MNGEVRFARSRDGASIAYSVRGQGPVLLHLQVPSLSHVGLYPQFPGAKSYLERLGAGRTLIEIDFRGTGLSERHYEDHSPEALTDDIEAVVDQLGLEQFDISAGGARVTPALGLAARRPGAVSRIVLGYPFNVRPVSMMEHQEPSLASLMEANWDLYLETSTQRNTGLPISELGEVLAFIRECHDQHNAVATWKARKPAEDWERAQAVECPVLVIEFLGNVHIEPGLMRAFADRFPRGRYVGLSEQAMPPPYGRPDLVLKAIHEFLGPPSGAGPQVHGGLTNREREILSLLATGRTQPQIAAELVISPSTVSRHVVSLYTKLGVHRRAEAVAWAIKSGIA